MNENNGPFDLAISILEHEIPWHEGLELNRYVRSLRSAIRILGAAGKVDKRGCLTHLEEHGIWNSCINQSVNINENTVTTSSINHSAQLRALLESLPDGEAEKKP